MNARWASWRRDLLFALAGALVALSTVLVPVGCLYRDAVRARDEADEQRAAAEAQTRIARQEADRVIAERKKAEDARNDEYKRIEQKLRETEFPQSDRIPRIEDVDDEPRIRQPRKLRRMLEELAQPPK